MDKRKIVGLVLFLAICLFIGAAAKVFFVPIINDKFHNREARQIIIPTKSGPFNTHFIDINSGIIINERPEVIGDMYPVFVVRVMLDRGGIVPVLVGSQQNAQDCLGLARLSVPVNVRCVSYGYGNNLPYRICTFQQP